MFYLGLILQGPFGSLDRIAVAVLYGEAVSGEGGWK